MRLLSFVIISILYHTSSYSQSPDYVDVRGYESLVAASKYANKKPDCLLYKDYLPGVIYFKNKTKTDSVPTNYDIVSDQYFLLLGADSYTIPKYAVDSVVLLQAKDKKILLPISNDKKVLTGEVLVNGNYKLIKTSDAKVSSKNYNPILDVGENVYSYKKVATYWLVTPDGKTYELPKKLSKFKNSDLPKKIKEYASRYKSKYKYTKVETIAKFVKGLER